MRSKSVGGGAYAARLMLSLPVAALVAGSPALAQAGSLNWTGAYAGFYAGGVWGRGNSTASSNCPPVVGGGPPGGYYCTADIAASSANAAAVTNAATGSVSSGQFTGGVQAGYNWQTGNIVFGLEADFGSFRIKGSRSASGVYPVGVAGGGVPVGTAFTVNNSFDTDWLFTARGRFGWAASNWLLFATGGLAMSRVAVAYTYADNNNNTGFFGAGSASETKTMAGWTVGAGLEYALARNWTIKAEYLYVDLGSLSALGTITNLGAVGYANALGVSTSLTAHIARLGANFRF